MLSERVVPLLLARRDTQRPAISDNMMSGQDDCMLVGVEPEQAGTNSGPRETNGCGFPYSSAGRLRLYSRGPIAEIDSRI